MAVYGDFLSLLQVGFGTGIGLSFFRAPLDLRINRARRELDDEWSLNDGVATSLAEEKRKQLPGLRIDLSDAVASANKDALIWMILALVTSLINLVLLIYFSFDAQHDADLFTRQGIVFLSVFSYCLIGAAMELIARIRLQHVHDKIILVKKMTKIPED